MRKSIVKIPVEMLENEKYQNLSKEAKRLLELFSRRVEPEVGTEAFYKWVFSFTYANLVSAGYKLAAVSSLTKELEDAGFIEILAIGLVAPGGTFKNKYKFSQKYLTIV